VWWFGSPSASPGARRDRSCNAPLEFGLDLDRREEREEEREPFEDESGSLTSPRLGSLPAAPLERPTLSVEPSVSRRRSISTSLNRERKRRRRLISSAIFLRSAAMRATFTK
jgi:hypothetical protein